MTAPSPPTSDRFGPTTLEFSPSEGVEQSGEHRGFGASMRYIAAALRANMLPIIAIMLASLALAVLVTMLQTPRYRATSSLQINSQSEQVLQQGEQTNNEDVNVWDVERFLQTQIDIIKSRGLAERVAQALKLYGNTHFYEAMGTDAPTAAMPQNSMRNMTIGLLRGNLTSTLPRNSRIISISFESTDPGTAAQVANAFAREFIAASLQRKFDSSAYARGFVADQLNEARVRLETSEEALNSYARRVGLIRTRDALVGERNEQRGGSVTTESLVQLNQAANDARARRIAAEGKWRAISGTAPLNAPEVLSNFSVQQLLTRRADVRAKLEQERAKHLEEHPSVIQLRAEAAEVERQLKVLVDSVRASVRSEYDAALNAEQDLQSNVTSLKAATLTEQDSAVQYNILAREADTNRTIYDGLLQRYKELNAAAGISASNISIIDTAVPPLSPSSPNLLLNLLIALVIGSGLAGLVVLLRDQFDDSVRVPEDAEAKLHMPLLGVVPKTLGDPNKELADPKSGISESYNSLVGTLLYASAQGLPQIILVTSAQVHEGKSTSSYAIARGLARIGKRTLLIDMDLRRPSQHKRWNVENKAGMSTLLTSAQPIESVIRDTEQTGLSLITSGPIPPSPTELIASQRMHALLKECAAKFDSVIIDSPPVLGLADAPLLGAQADGVVLIVEANRSRRGTLKSSLRRLRTMRPNMLGMVLSMFDPKRASNSYSEYYGYNYYQYNEADGAARASRA